MMYGDSRLPARFWRKVLPCPATGCWLWLAYTDGGYGRFGWARSVWLAHRVAYTSLVGPVVPPLQLDHLCRVRQCVNPLHLEPVTHEENMRRGNYRLGGEKTAAAKRAITHCPRGHQYAGDNLYVMPATGHRRCRQCARKVARERYVSVKASKPS